MTRNNPKAGINHLGNDGFIVFHCISYSSKVAKSDPTAKACHRVMKIGGRSHFWLIWVQFCPFFIHFDTKIDQIPHFLALFRSLSKELTQHLQALESTKTVEMDVHEALQTLQ